MSIATLRRQVDQLRQAINRQTPAASPALAAIRADPANLMAMAGMPPDPWQEKLLSCPSSRTLLLCCRQSGKSTASAALALLTALLTPGSLVLLLSPSLRQSSELFRKVSDLYRAADEPIARANPRDNAMRLELANGSRIVSLPGTERTVRGYSGAALLVIDEAARVPDALYFAVRPMLAVSRGRLVALSTPFIRAGWFHDEWHSSRPWSRVKVTAGECSRIAPEFLAEEREALGPRWYATEYECEFVDAIGSVFAADAIAAVADDAPLPLFLG